jgi:predicted Zn-dependent protease
MISKSLWSVALFVPFLIVAVVWSVASVYLFQKPPAQNFLTHVHHQNSNRTISKNDISCANCESTENTNLRQQVKTFGQLFENFGQRRLTTFGQQFIPMGYPQNMGSSMPPYAPPLRSNQNAFLSTERLDNYLSTVTQEGNFHWSPDRMPLKVYVSDGANVPGYRPEFRKMITDAFSEWCNTSNGVLSWKQVNSAKGADIVCSWTDTPTIRPGSVEAGQTRTLVQTNRDTGEGRIVTAQISILTALMGKNFSNENMYKTSLHEVGHALGLQGHSDVASDIMYPTVNEDQVARLKPRDVNTMSQLYSDTGFTASNPFGTSNAFRDSDANSTPNARGRSEAIERYGAPSASRFASPDGIQPFTSSGAQEISDAQDNASMSQSCGRNYRPYPGRRRHYHNRGYAGNGMQNFNRGAGWQFGQSGVPNQGLYSPGSSINGQRFFNQNGQQFFTPGGQQVFAPAMPLFLRR